MWTNGRTFARASSMKVEEFYHNQPLTQMSQAEIDCLLGYIGSEDVVLEIGSGYSTISLAGICRQLFSLEHDSEWFRKIHRELNEQDISNVFYTLKVPNGPRVGDGDEKSFKDYVEYVRSLEHVPFTKILIDGRARVECAFACGPSHPEAVFFLHDYGRYTETNRPWRKQYNRVLEKFDLVEQVETLAVLRYNESSVQ
jgi:hypothetical protein